MASCAVVFYRKILYLEPNPTFKEFEMVRNKHQDSTGGKEGNYGLETMVYRPSGCKVWIKGLPEYT